MIGANSTSAGQAGLVPAPAAGEANRYLRSDGQWVAITAQVFELENVDGLAHSELIANNTTGKVLAIGDIAIVKDIIVEGNYQHTAYVYNGTDWAAMDGNYNAENVYFDEDFTFTKNIGTVVVPSSGSIKVDAAGKNVKEFFASLFAAEEDPDITDPTASIKLQSSGSVEVGTSYTPSYAITFDGGNYEFGPATGVTATYAVTDTNGGSNTVASGKFDSFVVGDDTSYKITADVSYTQGAIPVSNIGNAREELRITEGVIEDLTTSTVKGYRNAFYGTLDNKNELTSDIIRGLSKTGKTMSNGNTMTINIPVGALRVVIAYVSTLRDLTEVLDKNDSNANIVSGFGTPATLQVEGADGYDAIDYKVYTMDFANPYDTANVFTAKI